MKLKKIITKSERNVEHQFLTKNIQSKSCRKFWRFSIERRAGRGCSGCRGAGGVFVSAKPSSLSIVMGFSADPVSLKKR